MKSILLIDTTWPINSRSERFRNSLNKRYDVECLAWDRSYGAINRADLSSFHIFRSAIGYGRRWMKLFYFPLFIFWSVLLVRKKEPDIVFASHWDSLVVACFSCFFVKRRFVLVYDCLDMPTSENRFVVSVLRFLESLMVRRVDLLILASRYFKNFYDASSCPSIVYENYPSRSNYMPGSFDKVEPSKVNSISWIGVVRYLEVFKNIMHAVKDNGFYFDVYGDGPALDQVMDYARHLDIESQVSFHGRYSMSELQSIYKKSQLVWAAYPTKDLNAVYAISNKYFECSLYGRIPIISKDTAMANDLKTRSNSVIFVDEYCSSDIVDKLASVDTIEFQKYELDTFWEDREIDFLNKVDSLVSAASNL